MIGFQGSGPGLSIINKKAAANHVPKLWLEKGLSPKQPGCLVRGFSVLKEKVGFSFPLRDESKRVLNSMMQPIVCEYLKKKNRKIKT